MQKIRIALFVLVASFLFSSYTSAAHPFDLSERLFKKYRSENFYCSMFRSFPCACGKSIKGGSAYKYRITLDSNYNFHCENENSSMITGTWKKIPEDRVMPTDNPILKLPFMPWETLNEQPKTLKDQYVFMACSYECSAVKNALKNLEKIYEKKNK